MPVRVVRRMTLHHLPDNREMEETRYADIYYLDVSEQ